MRKALSLLLTVLLVLLINVPVLAAPPDRSSSRQTIAIAEAYWNNSEKTETGFMNETWDVWIQPMDGVYYLSAMYLLEAYDEGDPDNPDDDSWIYEENSFSAELTEEQFNLNNKTISNDLTVTAGPVNITWDVLAVHKGRLKIMQNYDGSKYQYFERATIADCAVSGTLFDVELTPDSAQTSFGQMAYGTMSERTFG